MSLKILWRGCAAELPEGEYGIIFEDDLAVGAPKSEQHLYRGIWVLCDGFSYALVRGTR